jgi:long-chain acyl-CoA synthetase
LDKVDRLACGLSRIGLRGDRIGILALNSLEFVYLYGAAAKLGAIMLPINWRLNVQEIEYILSDGMPRVFFTDPEFLDLITPLVSKFAFIEKCYTIGEPAGNYPPFNNLMEKAENLTEVDVLSDDPYVIIYWLLCMVDPEGQRFPIELALR